MKYIRKRWRRLRKEAGKIHLVDKCLIVFMIVLLIQSACNLLTNGFGTSQSSDIDIIVRTSAASIFGYFISANFIRRDLPGADVGGTSLEETSDEENMTPADQREDNGRLQILIATFMGLFCLFTLLILRNFGGLDVALNSHNIAATVTQFRDFVSGCVGFLIGCPTSKKGGTS